MGGDYILEVSWGCPSDKWPTNGLFQFDQAKAIRDAGEKVVFLGLDMRSLRKWRKWGVNHFEKAGMPVYEFNFPYGPLSEDIKFKLQDYCFEKSINCIEEKYGKPRCIHVHTCQQAMAVTKYCAKEGIPYYITEHVWPIKVSQSLEKRMKQTYCSSAKVIAVSNALSKVLYDYCGVNCAVVHNIVDLDKFPFIAKTDKRNRFKFVSAAQIEYRKGMDILLKGFSIFLQEGYDADLTIMGTGSQIENIKNLSETLGLSNHVKFTGRYLREEFSNELRDSDCFVLVSRDETFGIVYIEALASGVPVIASDCGGPSDIVNDKNGLIVPMEDSHALAKAMRYVVDNIDYYDNKSISEECRIRYNANTIANEVIDVLNNKVFL